jgi:thioredoxin-like negative regulator of GroEL
MNIASLILLLASPRIALLPSPGSVASAQSHAITVSPDVTTGATLTGQRTFRVLVQSDDIINKVELYVNGELRDSQSSTPYLFSLDSINEKDGPLELKWVAYSDQGKTASKVVKVTVDNGMSLGAAEHVDKGTKALQDGNVTSALTEGRIALKIDKKYTPARELLARAYLAQKTYDRAQQYIEDVLADEPKNLEALDLKSAIGLEEAFGVISRDQKDMDTLKVVSNAFQNAVKARRASAQARFDAVGALTDTNLKAYVSAAIDAQRYSEAISALAPIFLHAPSRADLADRLAYCQIKAGRFEDAAATLNSLKVIGKNTSDAYADALTGLVAEFLDKSKVSDAAMDEAALNDFQDLGVQTAKAAIAIRRNDLKTAAQTIPQLANDAGQKTEVDYLLAVLYDQTRRFTDAKAAFRECVIADPLNYDMYIEEGNEALRPILDKQLVKSEDVAFNYAYAETMYKTALAAREDSYQALTALAMIKLIEKDPGDALNYAQAAVAAQPEYVAGQLLLAAAADIDATAIRPKTLPSNPNNRDEVDAYNKGLKMADDLNKLSVKANNEAGMLDPDHAGGRGIPSVSEAISYFVRFGRSPVISRPS